MTLRHLKIFVTVCENGGVTSAANKLFIAQPSVSLAIKELEEHYDTKLFDRIARKLYLTNSGKQFLSYALNIVTLFEQMEHNMKTRDFEEIITIGSSITIGTHILPRFVNWFKSQNSKIKVTVSVCNSEEIENKVLSNEIDFGLIEGLVRSPQVVCQKFMEDNLVIVASPDHKATKCKNLSAKSLEQYDFILREKGSGGRDFFDSLMLTHEIEITPVWESVSTQSIIQAVINEIGISVLPHLLVKSYLENGNLVALPIDELALSRGFNLIYHKDKFLNNGAKEFIEKLSCFHF